MLWTRRARSASRCRRRSLGVETTSASCARRGGTCWEMVALARSIGVIFFVHQYDRGTCCRLQRQQYELLLYKYLVHGTRYVVILFFSPLPSLFRFRFGHRLLHPVFFLWVLCCLLGFGFCWDSLSMWHVSWYVRTYVTLLLLPEICDLFQLLCVLCSVLICFPPEVIFRSRVIGACPVTTDCIVAMTQCENKNNVWSPYHTRYIRKKWNACFYLESTHKILHSYNLGLQKWSHRRGKKGRFLNLKKLA